LSIGGNVLFVADSEISSIRTVDLDPRGGHVRTIVGQGLFDYGDVDGAAEEVLLQHPLGVEYVDGTLFVADSYNHKIKNIAIESRTCITFAGSGTAGHADGDPDEARFHEPAGLSAAGGKLYVADTNNHTIRVIDLRTQEVSTLEIGVEKV
jgi:DNA-binding beta-propeller fold protein YncE